MISALPLEVLSAVGCRWRFPEAAVRVVPPMLDFRTLEHGLSLAYYVATRDKKRRQQKGWMVRECQRFVAVFLLIGLD